MSLVGQTYLSLGWRLQSLSAPLLDPGDTSNLAPQLLYLLHRLQAQEVVLAESSCRLILIGADRREQLERVRCSITEGQESLGNQQQRSRLG